MAMLQAGDAGVLAGEGAADGRLDSADLRRLVRSALEQLEAERPRTKVLVIPPDYTRSHSRAGELTRIVYEFYGSRVDAIMPALGTHKPMSAEQIEHMFGDIPRDLFRVHNWREDVLTIGHVPEELVLRASDGRVKESWPAQLNKLVWEGGHDLILSIGQVVPHEVMGMANHSKNLFVGVGGSQAIHFSHFIGAVYGMERMMGRADNPLRQVLDYACEHFLVPKLPVVYLQTVVGRESADEVEGDREPALVTRGLYIGKGRECFERASRLSLEVNFSLLDEPLEKVVVYLDPAEFKSTWLGNKSIYRTRMAVADGGELIVLAPGVDTFGEDSQIDAVIRKHGYRSTPEVLEHLHKSRDLMRNLSAAAHLIHGTSEGRFKITYCTDPAKLSKEEIESVGYNWAPFDDMARKYDPTKLRDGPNTVDGEEVFFVSNPAVGLWAYKGRFEMSNASTTREDDSEAVEPISLQGAHDAGEPSADAGVGGGPFAHGEGLDKPVEEPDAKRQKSS